MGESEEEEKKKKKWEIIIIIVANEAALDSAVSSLQYPKPSLEGAGMQGKG